MYKSEMGWILKATTVLNLVLGLISCFLINTCEEIDTTPPSINITSPQNGSIVSEIVTITCISSDNNGVEKVELWIDSTTTGIEDQSDPYSFEWNTVSLETNTSHTITVRSYDLSGNTTDSETISVTVDHSISTPSPSSIYPINLVYGSYEVNWTQNTDSDFSNYTLFESFSNDMSNETEIHTSTDQSDTTFIVTGIKSNDKRFFQLIVEDTFGFTSSSSITMGNTYGKIVFVSYRDGNDQIYLMDGNGSNQTRLTNNLDSDSGPQFFPDGSKILFLRRTESISRIRFFEIYTMELDGGNLINLSNNNDSDIYPDTSPDGTRVVVQTLCDTCGLQWYDDRYDDIHIMDSNGQNRINLTNDEYWNGIPSFSPDGNHIVFVSDRDGNHEIYIMDIDGHNQTRLTNSPNVTDLFPKFYPDGSQILYESSNDNSGVDEIKIMDLDGTNKSTIFEPSAHLNLFDFSPDGNQIILDIEGEGDDIRGIFIMDIDGSNLTDLTTDNDFDGPYNFHSSGTQIVYASVRNKDSEIYIMDLDGGNKTNITSTIGRDAQPYFHP